MERTRKSPGGAAKVKKKMTKEQMQLAVMKKKKCDSEALKIVMELVEPQVDPAWLVENLKNINKCHMEDVIEERAITKLCGYVLCQKPITVVMNQRYHISLREKKVYDVTKRKNFCSSSCFGASNYLLEQMLTSPLWLRDKEEIPEFRIFSTSTLKSNIPRGEEVDITIVKPCSKEDVETEKETGATKEGEISSKENDEGDKNHPNEIDLEALKKEVAGNIEDFVLETIKNMNIDDTESKESSKTPFHAETVEPDDEQVLKPESKDKKSNKKVNFEDTSEKNKNKDDVKVEAVMKVNTLIEKAQSNTENKNITESVQMKVDETNIIEQRVHLLTLSENKTNYECPVKQNINSKDTSENLEKTISSSSCDETLQSDMNKNTVILKKDKDLEKVEERSSSQPQTSDPQLKRQIDKLDKPRTIKRKKRTEPKVDVVVNLAAKVEQSFQEWITEDTIHFLFGDDSVKQKTIAKIETQDKYTILCEKLNKLQFQEEQEDDELLEKPQLKPAPHFAVLQEEGQKLDLKVRAFYHGKTAIEEPPKPVVNAETADSDTYLPLTDAHDPQALRRKIFLDRLDQVLPDLLRTLAGNNDIYARASLNYTSVRCTAVKALIHTFTLSAKNITFKTVEWTLVGLVIIKMLSLLDPWLANLLLTKQANMYISMILTSYKLDPHYLNLLVASFNPNVNPR